MLVQRNQAVKLSSLTIDQVSVPGHNHRLDTDQQAVRYRFRNWDKISGLGHKPSRQTGSWPNSTSRCFHVPARFISNSWLSYSTFFRLLKALDITLSFGLIILWKHPGTEYQVSPPYCFLLQTFSFTLKVKGLELGQDI